MARTFVGIDVNEAGLVCAALRKARPDACLVGMRQESLHEVLTFSAKKPNVRDSRRFVDALRRGVEHLAGREERFALSLPDRIGRILLVDVQTSFKSHQEGIDVLKWQLKNDLPATPAEVRLDYQVLERRDGARTRCLVAAARQDILTQYEQLSEEAGLHAASIGFHSLLFCNYYEKRMDAGDEFLLVGLEEQGLSLHYFCGRTLVYQRIKGGSLNAEGFFYELNRTLASACRAFPGLQRCPVFVHMDPALRGAMQEVLSEVFQRETTAVDPHFERFAGRADPGAMTRNGALVAALAAAESMM